MHVYGGDILYALKLKPWLRSNSVSRSFYYAIRSWTLFTNNSSFSRYLVVMAYRPTVTVQSQICGALTVSSMISHYLASE